jgi:hypothetical protein
MKQLSFAFMSRGRGAPAKFSEEQIAGWVVEFQAGATYKQIAECHRASVATVFWHLKKRLGLSGRPKGRKASSKVYGDALVSKTKLRMRKNWLRLKYNLTPEEYDTIFQEQEGKCAICQQPADKLCVDHCHDTNRVRGLLCLSCNFALGQFKDHPERLERAAEYVRTR